MSILSGFKSLSDEVNKLLGSDESVDSAKLPELTLDMKDEEIIAVTKQWEKRWEEYEPAIKKLQEENELYWLGEQFQDEGGKDRKLVDNLIFEALETFLPMATRPKPDPLVEGGNTPQGKQLSKKVARRLAYVADMNNYNLKLKQVCRFWALHLLGVMKVGWSATEDEIDYTPLRATKLILDPDGIIDGAWYQGEYIGEYKKDPASTLIARFPEQEKFITEKASGKLGTRLAYKEWWTPEYVCWVLGDKVLGKSKNPHWNYPQMQPVGVDEYGQIQLDEQGMPAMQEVPGNNHFKTPKMPYVFLSIFSLGKRPHDETSLITQNLPLQDLINLRLRQINKNANNTNGGIAVSGTVFDKEQAKQAADARRKGGAIWVPSGDPREAVMDIPAQPLPAFIYESLLDYRNELRNIFGTRGSTPQGTMQERTVRGKYAIAEQDMSRTGGGISPFLEVFSDAVFNWSVQLMYVYYDTPRETSVVGEGQEEHFTLSRQDFVAKLVVGVKEGSMLPKDPVFERNEAIDLWAAGGIDPISFFERLDFPNPREAAMRLTAWKLDPMLLFPELRQMMGEPGPQEPSKSISYKDLPPEGQQQLAAQAGIQLSPEALISQKVEQDLKEDIKAQRMTNERSVSITNNQ